MGSKGETDGIVDDTLYGDEDTEGGHFVFGAGGDGGGGVGFLELRFEISRYHGPTRDTEFTRCSPENVTSLLTKPVCIVATIQIETTTAKEI